jgi:hypothetical protein
MRHVRKRLTYANVMSSIAVFLILGGATAIAAGLAKNSVGPKQLKKNAVTALKIKKGAVTAPKLGPGAVGAGALASGAVGAGALANGAVGSDKLGPNAVTGEKIAANAVGGAKIAAGAVTGDKIAGNAVGSGNIAPDAVTGDKIAPGSVSAADINPAGAPFGQVVGRIRSTSAQALTTTPALYPLANPTFTQAAGQNLSWLGGIDVTFPSGCTQPRSASAYLSLDSPTPATLNVPFLSIVGSLSDTGAGTVSKTMQLSASSGFPNTLFESSAASAHTFSLLVFGNCTAGGGINVTSAGIDLIGTS